MLSARARDLIYLGFLLIHIPATLLVDIQALWFAENVSPVALRRIFEFAAKEDPLLQNANNPLFAWFQSFIILEIIFQLPTFFIGARGIWQGRTSIYPLLALYGISSATTTFACIATVLTGAVGRKDQLPMLLASYGPFLLVPLAMGLDYGIRLTEMARKVDEGKVKRS